MDKGQKPDCLEMRLISSLCSSSPRHAVVMRHFSLGKPPTMALQAWEQTCPGAWAVPSLAHASPTMRSVREGNAAAHSPCAHTLLWVIPLPHILFSSARGICPGDPGNPGLAARHWAMDTGLLLGQAAASDSTELEVESGSVSHSPLSELETGCY